MKALVLAGGAGTRLRPFSHSMPKQLVPVAGKPVLHHALDALRAAGVTEAGIIVSGAGAAIRASVGDGSRFGLAVTYLSQDEPRGLAHCVMIARAFLGDDDFVMYLGDNVFADGITEPVAAFTRDPVAAQLVVTKVTDPSQYGVAELDAAGRVTALEEKPARPRTDLAVTGLYCFTREIHEAIGRIKPSRRNEWEITDAVRWLVDAGRTVRAEVLSGYWADTGTLSDLLECNRVLLENISGAMHGTVDSHSLVSGSVVIGAGTTVVRSTIVGPAVIGAGCSIVGSRVGPFTSVGTGCSLAGAGMEHSILMDDVSVDGVRLQEGSIIGRAGKVSQAHGAAASHRLLIGDDSEVEVPA